MRPTTSLEASCSRLGVRAVDAEVLELQSTPSWCATTTNGERIEADVFIVATGAWSADLVRTITEDVQPMVSGSGVALVTERVMGDGFNSVVRTANRAGSCGLHVVPLSQGFEYYGATNVIIERPETRAHLGVINFLTDCVINQLDRLAAYSRIDKVVVGNRPVTLDTYPLLGRVEDTPVFMATGTYRDGLHSSPAIAAALRAEILDDEAAFDPVFAPTRRPILEFTRAEAIAEFTHQQVSSAFESGLSLTPFLHAQDLQAVFAPMAESLHDRLPDVVGLHPDLVAFACLSGRIPNSREDCSSPQRMLHMTGTNVELERLKMSCLVDGIRIDPRALDHLTSSGTATLSVHEYPTTGGLTLQFAEHVFVNAPFDEWFCGDARAELQLRSDGVGAMFEGTWFHLVDVLPLPGYLDRTLPDGTAVSSLVHTHADRVRLSPLAGCAYDCGFCDLPGLAYVQKSTEQLLEALTVAMSDEALPPRHALISGGSPRRKHYESFIATCAEVIRQAPLPVDVMLSPMVDNVECIDQLADAGVAGLSINLELFAPESADSILGTKWRTTRDWFEGFVDRAVSRLGTNGAVRSLIIPGLESADDTIRGVEYRVPRMSPSPVAVSPGSRIQRAPTTALDALTDILAYQRSSSLRLAGPSLRSLSAQHPHVPVGCSVTPRERRSVEVSNVLGNRRLYWFGIRGSDANTLLGLPQFAGSFSVTAPIQSPGLEVDIALESLTGQRVDLDTYDIDLDEIELASISEIRRRMLATFAYPSAIATYRPSDFLSSVALASLEHCLYLGVKDRQAVFEYKPW
jgi:hypothetical protein